MSTLHITAAIATLMVVMSSWASAQVMAPAPSPMIVTGQSPSSTSASSPAPVDGGSMFGPSASGPAAPEDPCLTALMNTTDCLTYVEAGSTQTTPDKACCPQIAGLLDSNPVCLCELVGSNITAQFGIQIDVERALKLPSLCKLSTPPTSLCAAVGYPIALPPGSALSPESSSPSTSPASSPLGGANEKDGAASIAVSATSLFFGLVFSFLTFF